MSPVTPLFGPVGPELLILLLLILLLFGASKLPTLARNIGKSTKEFKKAREESNTKTSTSSTVSTTATTDTTQASTTETKQTTEQPDTEQDESHVEESIATVDGIGDTYETRLTNAGITTADELANSEIQTVADAAEVSDSKAEKFITTAEQLIERET